MEKVPFDREVTELLEEAYQTALKINNNRVFSPEHIKMLILITNLEAMAKTFILASDTNGIDLDLKKVALGVFGTIDWIRESL